MLTSIDDYLYAIVLLSLLLFFIICHLLCSVIGPVLLLICVRV